MGTVVFTSPRTFRVLGLQKLLIPFIFRGNVSLPTLMTLVRNGPAGGGSGIAASDTGAPEDTGADIGRSAVGTPYLSFGDLRGRE